MEQKDRIALSYLEIKVREYMLKKQAHLERSKRHWKPSEEQMMALKHCCDGWQDNADGRLESLYNDLKKL